MRKENSSNAINEKALQEFCNASKTLALFSGRWKLSILFQLSERATNYTAFKIRMPDISDRTLSKQLNELSQDGLIWKEKDKTSSVYGLTKKGLKLVPILVHLANFQL